MQKCQIVQYWVYYPWKNIGLIIGDDNVKKGYYLSATA
jgi:hypothetical protein